MQLTIGWFFPKRMNIYGDRGNVIALMGRAKQRGIKTEMICMEDTTQAAVIEKIDLFLGGGAQDREQEAVLTACEHMIGPKICKRMEQGMPALFVCGALQIFGKSFETQSGQVKKGLGFFDCETRCPEKDEIQRLVGDLIMQITAKKILQEISGSSIVIGFENHRNRSYLIGGEAFGQVLKGYGNNGKDKMEGVFTCNAIGTYAHGPILPKNPILTDWLLKTALEMKYQKKVDFCPLDDPFAEASREVLLERLLRG